METIREVEEDITVDSTFIRFSCEAVEDSLSMLLAEDCDVAVWAVGRLDVDMELPALTISWGTAAAIATAPWNTFIRLNEWKIGYVLEKQVINLVFNNSFMASFIEFIFFKFCLFCFLPDFFEVRYKESIDDTLLTDLTICPTLLIKQRKFLKK